MTDYETLRDKCWEEYLAINSPMPAACNGNSPRHEEILRLVKDNMSLIRRAAAAAKAIEKSKKSKKSTNPKLCQRV